MLKKFGLKGFIFLVMLGSLFTLSACSKEAEEVKLANSYAYSVTGPFEYQGTVLGTVTDSYLLNVYDNGTYNLIQTSVTTMGGTNGGVTVWESFGTFEKGAEEDGFIPVTLSDANRAIYTSYSTLGGYAFRYDSETVEDWATVELGGAIMMETKENFLSQVPGKTVYIVLNSAGDETAQLSFEG